MTLYKRHRCAESTGRKCMKFRYSLQVLTAALAAFGLNIAATDIACAQASDAPASAAPSHDTKLSPADQQFVLEASKSDATEIAASKIALKNSHDPHVKQFAQQMIKDHTKLSRGMAALVSKKGFTSTPSADSALVGKLQTLNGTAFDQAYVEQVGVEAHQRAVDLFQQQSESGTDSQLKAAAKQALPIIRHHLEMAQQLAGQMKGSS
jgi:putative membrane protein